MALHAHELRPKRLFTENAFLHLKNKAQDMKWEITIKYDMGNNNNAHLTAHERLKACLTCENNMRVS